MGDTPDMHIDAMARLQMLRGMLVELIGNHPEPTKALQVVAACRAKLRTILAATAPGEEGHRKASEGMAEIEVLIGRLQRAQDLKTSPAAQQSQTRSAASAHVRRDTPDRERD